MSSHPFYMGGTFENRFMRVPLTKQNLSDLSLTEVDMCRSSQLYKISMFDNPLPTDLFLFAQKFLSSAGKFWMIIFKCFFQSQDKK